MTRDEKKWQRAFVDALLEIRERKHRVGTAEEDDIGTPASTVVIGNVRKGPPLLEDKPEPRALSEIENRRVRDGHEAYRKEFRRSQKPPEFRIKITG